NNQDAVIRCLELLHRTDPVVLAEEPVPLFRACVSMWRGFYNEVLNCRTTVLADATPGKPSPFEGELKMGGKCTGPPATIVELSTRQTVSLERIRDDLHSAYSPSRG